MKLNKVLILRILNPLLFLVVLFQGFTVIAMKFFFSSLPWVGDVHEVVGYCLFALVLLHIVFNWDWIRSVLFRMKKK